MFFYLHSISSYQKKIPTQFSIFLSCSRQFSCWFLHKLFMTVLTGVSGTWFSYGPDNPPWIKPTSSWKWEGPQVDLSKTFWQGKFPNKLIFQTEMLSFVRNWISFALNATKCPAIFANVSLPFSWLAPNPYDLSDLSWHRANGVPWTSR